MNLFQQNGRKEILTDEQAFGWKKSMNSINHNAHELKEINELNSKEWKKVNAQDERASSWE